MPPKCFWLSFSLICGVSFASAQERTITLTTFSCTGSAEALAAQPELRSPDRQWTLENESNVCADGQSVLWIRSARGDKRRIRQFSGSIQAQWAPDSRAFFLNVRESSDNDTSYVIEPNTLQTSDLKKVLVALHPASDQFTRAGHSYLSASCWLNSRELLVRLNGHFDFPVVVFDRSYRVNLNGSGTQITDDSFVGCPR